MPTFEALARFLKDYGRLDQDQRRAFAAARQVFVDDLRTGRGFRPGPRVKRVQSTADVWEMSWAPDGRATWQYGDERKPGEQHVIWRRIGTHNVFREPQRFVRSTRPRRLWSRAGPGRDRPASGGGWAVWCLAW